MQGGGGVAVAAQDLASCHQLALHVAGVGAVTDPAAQVGAGVLDAAGVGCALVDVQGVALGVVDEGAVVVCDGLRDVADVAVGVAPGVAGGGGDLAPVLR